MSVDPFTRREWSAARGRNFPCPVPRATIALTDLQNHQLWLCWGIDVPYPASEDDNLGSICSQECSVTGPWFDGGGCLRDLNECPRFLGKGEYSQLGQVDE